MWKIILKFNPLNPELNIAFMVSAKKDVPGSGYLSYFSNL